MYAYAMREVVKASCDLDAKRVVCRRGMACCYVGIVPRVLKTFIRGGRCATYGPRTSQGVDPRAYYLDSILGIRPRGCDLATLDFSP